MNFLVCIKLVPDVSDVKIDKETNNLIRDNLKMMINPSDLCALKFALNLKKKNPDSNITVISMGPKSAVEFLRDTIQMGADDCYLIEGEEFKGSDTLATSYALASAIRYLNKDFDVIFTGDQAIDGDTGQVGPELSEFLGINLVSFADSIIYKDGAFELSRITFNGKEELRVQAPFVVTILKESARRPSKFSESREEIAKNATINILNAKTLGLDKDKLGQTGSATRVARIFEPSVENRGCFIEGNSDDDMVESLISILKDRNLIG